MKKDLSFGKRMRLMWANFNIALRNRKESEEVINGFRFTFRRFSMEIRSLSDNFRLRVLCTEHSWGYLRESMKQGRKDNLEGYAIIMYSMAVNLTKDQKLVADVTRDIKGFAARLERQAQKAAKEEKMSEGEEAGILLHETMVAEAAEKELNKKNRK